MPSSAPYNQDGRSVNTEVDGNLSIKTCTGTDGNLTVAGTTTLTGALTTNGGVTNNGLVNGIGANSSDSPTVNGYLAWNYPVLLASSAITLTTTDLYGWRFIAPRNLTATNLDVYCTNMNSGTVTKAKAAIYPNTDGAGYLSTTTDIYATWTGTGIQTWTFSTPPALVAGTEYVVLIFTTATTSGPSIAAAPTVAALNVNLAAHAGNYFTYSTGSDVPATFVLATCTNSGTTPFWFGIR